VTVAGVQGHAIGGGFQLALGADLRILAADAQFTMAEPSLGLVPDLGGTKRLVDLVGYSVAADICLTGRRVPADEALRIGLASRVVPNERLDEAIEETVRALLAVDRDAAAETKALLQHAATRTQDEQQAAERDAQYRRLRTVAGLDAED
jgi:enoyl-CoA hydratase/carnithine racemase